MAIPSSGVAQVRDELRFLTYAQAVAEGLPVPENDPALPFCVEGEVDPGFRSVAEEEASVDDNGPDTCQVDVRDMEFVVNARRGVTVYGR